MDDSIFEEQRIHSNLQHILSSVLDQSTFEGQLQLQLPRKLCEGT